jgi:Uncharacterized protein conserved in bacteria
MFYIYEHIRPDTNAVFYVGKGSGVRYKSLDKRNKHWHNIVNKCDGFMAKILVNGLDEELCFLAEEERINQLKRLGIKLANKTNGGGGGTKGYRHTEKTKQRISEKHKEFYKHNPAPCAGKFGVEHPAFGLSPYKWKQGCQFPKIQA